MGPSLPKPGGRQWFIFAMKDPLPLSSDGWGVIVHEPECFDSAGQLRCVQDRVACFATRVHFVSHPHHSDDIALAVHDMSGALDELIGRTRDEPPEPVPIELPDGLRWVAATSTGVHAGDGPGDVFDRAFNLLSDAVAALRNATGTGIPDPTIERMHPFYLTAHEDVAGNVEPTGVVVVTHVSLGSPAPASKEQLQAAQQLLFGRWLRSPVETYRTFSMQARLAVTDDGDYVKAVLMAAIACEVLIKNAAWMLTFEGSRMETDPAFPAAKAGLGRLKPSQLIGRVLQERLGGSWTSNDPTQPVGAWRHHVARVRSNILHKGRRPTAVDADEALIAMGELERHVADRMTARSTVYPRTAYVQVGPDGLHRRGRLDAVVQALDDPAETPDQWISEYVRWLDALLEKEGTEE